MPDPCLPPTLVERLVDGNCVLFAGSGLSAAAGLPTWQTLLGDIVKRLREEGRLHGSKQEAAGLLKSGKFLELADCCKEKAGEALLHEILYANVGGNDVSLPEIHRAIVRLPFIGIITTNFDTLLERAYTERTRNTAPAFTNRETKDLASRIFRRRFYIFKAHGDIHRTDSIIFTARDYQRISHANPAFRALLSSILITSCVIFVGYSLSDPDFRLILDQNMVTFEGFSSERYALLRDVGTMERELLKRTLGINVISYSSHDELLPFFLALEKAVIAENLARKDGKLAT